MTFRNSKAVTGIIDWVHFLNNGKTLKPGPFSCNIPSGKASIKRLPMIFKSAALLGSICYRDLGEGARESDLQQGAQWWHGNRRRRR
jgi:hypothetical protein